MSVTGGPTMASDQSGTDEPVIYGPVAASPTSPPLPAPVAARPLTIIERLRDGRMTDRLAGWLVTLSITALAFVIRFVNLAYPDKVIFDETYYAKDAYTLWKFGYEKDWPKPEIANPDIIAGNPDVYLDKASFIVHPPVGKWLIGFGEHLFGMNSFGWRFMPLVFGTLLVFATIRLTRRLSRSTLLGGLAGLLLTVDGLAFTMSRIALLDIFEAFFLVVAVSCCVADRDWYRWKLADRLEKLGLADFGGEFGPMIWFRPWRLAAGVAFGLAIGSKWNAVFALAVFGLLSVWWDIRARHLAGSGWQGLLAVVVDGIPAFIRLAVVSAVVYVATWAGWLTTSGGWGRDWGATHPDDPVSKYLGATVASFLHYHTDIYSFHTGEYIKSTTHPYDAHPAGWLVLARPITFDAVNDIQPGVDGCPVGGETCQRVLIALGTPTLWWMAAVALLVAIIWWIGGRDWRFGVPVLAALSTYVPWFFTTDRPQFHFYAITIVPFTVIALTLVLGLILGPKDGPHRRRRAIIVGVAVALVVANFAWNYPVLTDGLLTKSQWLVRMWLRSWI